MTGSFWRLLASVCFIFVAYASQGQDVAEFSRLLDLQSSFRSDLTDRDDWTMFQPVHPRTPFQLPKTKLVSFQNAAFIQMVRSAGIIFSGRVTSVGRSANFTLQNPASTEVIFKVDQAIRGVAPSSQLTIREWAGLWNRGERYRVGEKVLLFLYPPSKLGLTSPVSGSVGRFPVDSQGMIVFTAQHLAAFALHPLFTGKTIVPYHDFATTIERAGRKE